MKGDSRRIDHGAYEVGLNHWIRLFVGFRAHSFERVYRCPAWDTISYVTVEEIVGVLF